MEAVINGAGLMGRAIAYDLAGSDASRIVLNDADPGTLAEAEAFVDDDAVETERIDVSDAAMTEYLEAESPDVVVNALPHELSVPALERSLAAGVDAVDLAFEEEQYGLAERAEAEGVTLVTGCGVAPGISNMLAGDGVSRLDDPESVSIKVGGIPADPQPPLEYRVVFHLDSVWNAYTRPARIRRDGEAVEVPALSGVEPVEFEGVGELECFYTDGLGTLPDTFEGVANMEEKTVRYPGHATKARALRECGLLGTEPVEVGGAEVAPREFLTELLTPDIYLGDGHDLTVMRVDVAGDGGSYGATLVDRYDDSAGMTSMARTTGFTAAIVARRVADGDVEGTGLVAPETFGADRDALDAILAALGERGVEVDRELP